MGKRSHRGAGSAILGQISRCLEGAYKTGDFREYINLAIVGLGDKNLEVREQIARMIGSSGRVLSVQVRLIERLGDKNCDARHAVALCTIRYWGEVSRIPPLLLGNDKERMIRNAAETLIGIMKDKDEEVRSGAIKALGWLGDACAVEPLIRAINDEDYDVCRDAIDALGEIGDIRAFEPLIEALRIDRYPSRAAEALGKLGDRRAVEPLIRMLGEGHFASARSSTAEALGRLRDARAYESLIRAIDDEDDSVRSNAARALGMLGDVRATGPLMGKLCRGQYNLGVIDALVALDDRRAIRPLTRIVAQTNNDEYIRLRATEALRELNERCAIEQQNKSESKWTWGIQGIKTWMLTIFGK